MKTTQRTNFESKMQNYNNLDSYEQTPHLFYLKHSSSDGPITQKPIHYTTLHRAQEGSGHLNRDVSNNSAASNCKACWFGCYCSFQWPSLEAHADFPLAYFLHLSNRGLLCHKTFQRGTESSGLEVKRDGWRYEETGEDGKRLMWCERAQFLCVSGERQAAMRCR